MKTMQVAIGKLRLRNPVMVASGTFGYGDEFKGFFDISSLGALVTKTITLRPRQGNPPPRTCETPSGMLNSIGLENPGIDVFIDEKLPFLAKLSVPLVVSIASEESPDEFTLLAKRIRPLRAVAALELNISCPNVGAHPRSGAQRKPDLPLISQDPRATFELVKTVRKAWDRTLITKLSPNVTSIKEIALQAERAGSDAVAVINTLTGMAIDAETRKPKLARVCGGLSGPALRPVAVRMVREVYQACRIPVIGMGGIQDTASALEFIIAGATAIGIGTANFINPRLAHEIIVGLQGYVRRHRLARIGELIGALQE